VTTDAALAAHANVAPSREFLERQAFEAFKAFALAFQQLIESPSASVPIAVGDTTTKDVMTADQVAEFLGVDRNTVYDFASRGVIPHQRLGKRLLFRRGAVVAWLDTSLCNATSRST
jgi:excisionase family DNA binding protein